MLFVHSVTWRFSNRSAKNAGNVMMQTALHIYRIDGEHVNIMRTGHRASV